MKQIKEILIASVSLFLLGFGICMAVSTFFMYREGEQEYEALREYVNEEEREEDESEEDGEVAPYEDMENATLLQKECYDLDEDTMIEITTYEKSIPSFARSSWKTKTGTRTYRIINKKSNTVFVRYILKGTFKYNGKSAQCTDATTECKVLVPNVYNVVTNRAEKAGNTVLGYFYCTHVKTGKGMGGTFSIKCAANGTLTIN